MDTLTTNPADDAPAPEVEVETDLMEGQEPEAQDTPEDDHEDVEHEGKSYRIPKALKGALLMHSDYTRKTQEVAEERRAVEAEKASVQTARSAHADHIKALARVQAMDDQLDAYAKVDWNALQMQDPELASTHWRQRTLLTEARQAAQTELETKERDRATEGQRAHAKAVGDAQAVLARDIKGWSPELAGKLGDFAAKEFGVSPQELGQITDPRIVKLLHRAYEGSKAQKTQAATAQAKAAETVRPTPKIGGGSPPPKGLDDRQSTEDWMAARDAQAARKG